LQEVRGKTCSHIQGTTLDPRQMVTPYTNTKLTLFYGWG